MHYDGRHLQLSLIIRAKFIQLFNMQINTVSSTWFPPKRNITAVLLNINEIGVFLSDFLIYFNVWRRQIIRITLREFVNFWLIKAFTFEIGISIG